MYQQLCEHKSCEAITSCESDQSHCYSKLQGESCYSRRAFDSAIKNRNKILITKNKSATLNDCIINIYI